MDPSLTLLRGGRCCRGRLTVIHRARPQRRTFTVFRTDCFEQYFCHNNPQNTQTDTYALRSYGVFGEQKDGEIRCEGSRGSDRQQGQICRYGYRINTHCGKNTDTHTRAHTHLLKHSRAYSGFKMRRRDDLEPF